MKCDKCLNRIEDSETYFELQEWEMENDNGHECGDTRLCSDCYFKMKSFLAPSS